MQAQKPGLLSYHFSHEHPLELTNSIPRKSTTCFGCNLTIFSGKSYYKCKNCLFYLHQVCHNMPKKVQHPADPTHHLTLKSMPINSSSNPSFSSKVCKACEHTLSGFYYNCAKCEDFYHILCSAVPLSVKTPSHQHILTLEYSPPYDFRCDLCEKPSYSGWLYHCNLCEFDVHLACAITNKGAQLLHNQTVPKPPNSLDRNINKQQELMELLTRGLIQGIEETEDDESTQIIITQDQPTRLLEDSSFTSYFSDACFSIDFAKSLLGNDDGMISGVNNQELPGVKEIKSPAKTVNHNDVIMVGPKHVKQESSSNVTAESTLNPHLRSSFNRLNISLLAGVGSKTWMQLDPEAEKRTGIGFKDKTSAAKDQSTSSDSASEHGLYRLVKGPGELILPRRVFNVKE